jgi:hypothetical protein
VYAAFLSKGWELTKCYLTANVSCVAHLGKRGCVLIELYFFLLLWKHILCQDFSGWKKLALPNISLRYQAKKNSILLLLFFGTQYYYSLWEWSQTILWFPPLRITSFLLLNNFLPLKCMFWMLLLCTSSQDAKVYTFLGWLLGCACILKSRGCIVLFLFGDCHM